MTEREIERLIFAYPEQYLGEDLQPVTIRAANGTALRTDLIFRDSDQRMVVVEVKKGVVPRTTVAQLLDYYGLLRQQGYADSDIRLMIAGQGLDPIQRPSLERARIEYREVLTDLFKKSSAKERISLDWEAKLEGLKNREIAAFYRCQLLLGVEAISGTRWRLTYRLGKARRWTVDICSHGALVRQRGHFDGDAEYWRPLLTNKDIKAMPGDVLRFYLEKRTDCGRFLAAQREIAAKRLF